MKDRPLRGKNIVVTRPAHLAQELADLIRAAGGTAILFPVIEILDVEALTALKMNTLLAVAVGSAPPVWMPLALVVTVLPAPPLAEK